jgi:hypothetical protein
LTAICEIARLRLTVAKQKDPDRPEWRDIAAVFVLRVTDSGLTPWALVAIFLVAVIWVMTRNLDSQDTLALISNVGTVHGIAWLGWGIAFIEIPIAKWAINRARRSQNAKIEELEKDSDRAREQLKKLKQSELRLASNDK